jgi:hypothetical protein
MVDQNLLVSIRNKISRYTREECDYAKQDCAETLKLHPANSPYSAKLWAEIDTINERLAVLQGSVTCPCCHGSGKVKPRDA